jgi:hypothetical protein
MKCVRRTLDSSPAFQRRARWCRQTPSRRGRLNFPSRRRSDRHKNSGFSSGTCSTQLASNIVRGIFHLEGTYFFMQDLAQRRIEETLALLHHQRPDDLAEYGEPLSNEVHFAFTDTRHRRYLVGIARRLLLRWSSEQIVQLLVGRNWHLVMGAFRNTDFIPILNEEGGWDFKSRYSGHLSGLLKAESPEESAEPS